MCVALKLLPNFSVLESAWAGVCSNALSALVFQVWGARWGPFGDSLRVQKDKHTHRMFDTQSAKQI